MEIACDIYRQKIIDIMHNTMITDFHDFNLILNSNI
jgi:hypothetical protein